jgi:hypothetical protein
LGIADLEIADQNACEALPYRLATPLAVRWVAEIAPQAVSLNDKEPLRGRWF